VFFHGLGGSIFANYYSGSSTAAGLKVQISSNEKEEKDGMTAERKHRTTDEIGTKYSGNRCKDIVGDLVGTPDGKQICGGIILQTYTRINEILASNNFLS